MHGVTCAGERGSPAGGDDRRRADAEAVRVTYGKVAGMLRSMTSLKGSITVVDACLAALFVALGVAYMIAVVDDEGGTWAAVPVITLVAVPLLWRRVAPLQALAGLIAAVGVHAALFGTVTRCGLVLPIDFLLVFAAGARLPWRLALAGWVLGLGAALLMLGFDQSAPLDDAGVFAGVLVTVVWVVGAALHAVAHRAPARGVTLEPARS